MEIIKKADRSDNFNKRFYRPSGFFKDLAAILKLFPSITKTIRSRSINRAFAEKIMLVVSQVNGCRYCSYGHAKMALNSGVSEAEIEKLLALEFGHFPPEQAIALAFAQHYAESEGKPDPEAESRFIKYYGPEVSGSILLYIRMITLGNLSGNAADAFLSRLSGRPAQNSSALSELFLFILFAPIILPLLALMKRKAN
jgi:AhpD family alkylhydroperoxidase